MSEEVDCNALRMSRDMKDRGFVGGSSPVFGSHPQFSIEQLKAAICDSTLDDPKTLTIKISHEETAEIFVSMLRAVYEQDAALVKTSSQPLKYYPSPNWQFEGWVHSNSQFLSWPVRGFIIGDPRGLDEVTIQLYPEFPEPEALITYIHEDDD
jgi:hypothetical protein